MASIRRRGNSWQAQIRKDGHPQISRTFKRKGNADIWARQTEAQIERGELPIANRQALDLRFCELIARYRDTVSIRKQGAEIERIRLNAFLKLPFANSSLRNLTSAQISQYKDQRLEVAKSATVRRELGLLQHIFEIARKEWGIPITVNPVASVG